LLPNAPHARVSRFALVNPLRFAFKIYIFLPLKNDIFSSSFFLRLSEISSAFHICVKWALAISVRIVPVISVG
jgi:hypothetical protein